MHPNLPVTSRAVGPRSWRVWVEPWYTSYALLGVTVAGLVPILLPMAVGDAGNVADAGLVLAALSLGGLSAPLWGGLADRYHLHRRVLAAGLFATALALACFSFMTSLFVRIALALALGAGSSASATVANLFVVELHPEDEWEKRIGWLQTFYGAGQVAGLLLAAWLSGVDRRIGLIVAAGLTLLAVVPGWFTRNVPPRPGHLRPPLKHPARHSEFSAGSPQRFYHFPGPAAAGRISMPSAFGLFLLAWLVSFAGAAAFFTLYPVIMKGAYGVEPGVSAGGFAIAAAAGLTLYSAAARWSDRYGPAKILRAALGVRLVAFVGMLALVMSGSRDKGMLAMPAVLLLVLAWSLLSVSGTALSAEGSRISEGEGIGLFNAASSLGGVIGAALGGWSANRWGYGAVPIVAIVGLVLGILLSFAAGNRLQVPGGIKRVLPRSDSQIPNPSS